jgi:hypothetical protein
MTSWYDAKFTCDVSKLPADQQRKALVHIARTAEGAERYEDMARYMRALVEWVVKDKDDLTVEERNLLSVAFKNVIGARRASHRTLNQEPDAQFKEYADAYRAQVEEELEGICKDILSLLEDSLIKNLEEREKADKDAGKTIEAKEQLARDEAKVFYLKMAGDYFRYRAESAVNAGHDQSSADYYGKAFDLAKEVLLPTHPVRLGLVLNYSVCHYEILKNKKTACKLAKDAFDAAISKLDQLEEDDYKDSTLIMQLLRDNLTLWTSDGGDDDGTQVQDLDDQ